MAAVCTGLALSGFFIPYASTFMVFSDYLRPSLRLAAMMKLQIVYLFSHDSIFVGEDGPTHQPLEHLTAMRIIPNLDVMRPADASETAAAWAYALARRDGPTVIATARQKTPPLPRPEGFDVQALLSGAYVLADAPSPSLVIIATGSEVHVALEAKEILAQKGVAARVVSAPCWEQFERQPPERQAEILPPGVRRVVVEAGLSTLWRAVAGLDGLVIGLEDFGASAPAERLQREYGLTGAQIAARIQEWL
jgi:transketolase